MVHLTMAIADFMKILIVAALWAGASAGGIALLVLALTGLTLWLARKLVRRLLHMRPRP